jgi:hypothetical protein
MHQADPGVRATTLFSSARTGATGLAADEFHAPGVKQSPLRDSSGKRLALVAKDPSEVKDKVALFFNFGGYLQTVTAGRKGSLPTVRLGRFASNG